MSKEEKKVHPYVSIECPKCRLKRDIHIDKIKIINEEQSKMDFSCIDCEGDQTTVVLGHRLTESEHQQALKVFKTYYQYDVEEKQASGFVEVEKPKEEGEEILKKHERYKEYIEEINREIISNADKKIKRLEAEKEALLATIKIMVEK